MKNKKVLTTPDDIDPEVKLRDIKLTKEEIAPFAEPQEDVAGHEGDFGRDWNTGSKDDE